MTCLLIDHEGAAFGISPLLLQRRLGVAASDIDLVGYAVRNMGFLELRLESGRLRIAARPALLSPATLEAAAETVERWPVRRVVLSVLDAEWSATIFGAPQAAFQRLRALCLAQSSHPAWSTFSAEPVPMARLEGRGYDAMRLLAAEWTLLGGNMDDEMMGEFMGRRLPSNSGLARRSSDGKGLVFQHSRILDRPWTSGWMKELGGRDLRQSPDHGYAAWVMAAYHDVLARGRPRLERVKARLRCPEFGNRSFDYDRLLLPWRTRGDEPVATLVSVVRSVKSG
jgi:hypothetical protein